MSACARVRRQVPWWADLPILVNGNWIMVVAYLTTIMVECRKCCTEKQWLIMVDLIVVLGRMSRRDS